MAGLKIEHLSKSFGENPVIEDISFDVQDGEFCILLGPSGCGKSTILRLIAGLELQDEGHIFIGDNEVSALSPKERDVAMVFQSYALYPHMNVYDNIAFSLKMKRASKQEIDNKVYAAARMLAIEDLMGRKPKELSGGQRQRVSIGRAIVRDPQLSLFDEPLSNLDAKLRAAMRVELAALHRRLKSTILYVTHDQIEAMTLGHKIVLLHEGKIQQVGSPKDLYDKPFNLFVSTFIGSPQINLMDGMVTEIDGRLHFRSESITIDVDRRKELRAYKEKNVTLGIRPEALVPDEGPVSAVVEFVEHLGSETILYCRIGRTHITVRVLYEIEKSIGEEVHITVSDKGMHFFHAGLRVA